MPDDLHALEAAVAAEVLGWTDVRQSKFGASGLPPGERLRIYCLAARTIGAAWEVVEALRARWRASELKLFWEFAEDPGGWQAIVISEQPWDNLRAVGSGPTLPEAICRCALAWVRAQRETNDG